MEKNLEQVRRLLNQEKLRIRIRNAVPRTEVGREVPLGVVESLLREDERVKHANLKPVTVASTVPGTKRRSVAQRRGPYATKRKEINQRV
jgi:hypothetical protein